jgi:hypothetical protein
MKKNEMGFFRVIEKVIWLRRHGLRRHWAAPSLLRVIGNGHLAAHHWLRVIWMRG